MSVCDKMFVLLKIFFVLAQVEDALSATYCKLDIDSRVQYCFDPRYVDGLRRCNSYEPEDVILRPGCSAAGHRSNSSLPPKRCVNGNWENLYECKPVDASKDDKFSQPDKNEPETCKLKDGQIGECVPYHLCNTTETKVIWDGAAGVIDIEVGESNCKSNIYTCCPTSVASTTSGMPIKGCGRRNPEGVAFRTKGAEGGATRFGEFPWVCALLKVAPVVAKEPDGEKLHEYIGAGSLIHPSVVLTVAHIVADEKQMNARAGEWDTRSTNEIYPFQERDVASVVVHEDFNSVTLFYDIALLFLAQPMKLAPNVGVACLPPPKTSTPDGTRCFATGWGQDQYGKGRFQTILQKVEVPVVENKKCQEQLRETRLGEKFQLHSSFMCGGGEEGEYTCRAGWGAPLSCPIETEPGRYMQSGIVARSVTCGGKGVPDVHVDVANLREWIDDKVVGKGYDHKVYTY